MSRLMKTNFMRLWKDKIFWASVVVMVCSALYKTISILIVYSYSEPGDVALSNVFFKYTTYILIIGCVFCSLYIGTEYSDGTIRNKLIMGHRRRNIYCANLIVCIIANLIMCLAYIVASLIGLSLGFYTSITDTLLGILCSFLLVCSVTSLFTMIAMLSKRKTVAAVICVVLSFLLLLYAYEIRNEVCMAWQNGEEKPFYEFLYSFLPSCQAVQLANEPEMFNTTSPMLRILYAIVLFVLTTGIGILLFRKKDLE